MVNSGKIWCVMLDHVSKVFSICIALFYGSVGHCFVFKYISKKQIPNCSQIHLWDKFNLLYESCSYVGTMKIWQRTYCSKTYTVRAKTKIFELFKFHFLKQTEPIRCKAYPLYGNFFYALFCFTISHCHEIMYFHYMLWIIDFSVKYMMF